MQINYKNTGFNEWITIYFDKRENANNKLEYLVHLDHAELNTAGFMESFVSKTRESIVPAECIKTNIKLFFFQRVYLYDRVRLS